MVYIIFKQDLINNLSDKLSDGTENGFLFNSNVEISSSNHTTGATNEFSDESTKFSSKDSNFTEALALGDLAQISVSNEIESNGMSGLICSYLIFE